MNPFKLLLFLLFIFSSALNAQENWGGKIGINFQFGTHIQRLGLMYQVYYYNNTGQVSQGIYVHYNFKNLGPKGGYAEAKFHLGAHVHWGKSTYKKYQFNELSNLSPHDYKAGYSFYVYLDGKELSQTTGNLQLGLKEFEIAVDNDAFGTNPYADKFRTGAFYISYQVDSLLLSIQSTLWTGLSFDAPKFKDKSYPAKKGYRDPSNVKYGEYSHGIFAIRADYYYIYAQTVRAEVGVDAERVRNFFQNKVIHNALPDRWVGYENPHYPMLQENGKPFLFKEGEKIKRTRAYLQLGNNQTAFY